MIAAPLISRLFIYTAVGAVIAGAAMPHHASSPVAQAAVKQVAGIANAKAPSLVRSAF